MTGHCAVLCSTLLPSLRCSGSVALLCPARLYCLLYYFALLYSTACSTVLCSALPCSTALLPTLLCSALLCSAPLYCLLYFELLCCALSSTSHFKGEPWATMAPKRKREGEEVDLSHLSGSRTPEVKEVKKIKKGDWIEYKAKGFLGSMDAGGNFGKVVDMREKGGELEFRIHDYAAHYLVCDEWVPSGDCRHHLKGKYPGDKRSPQYFPFGR